VLALRPVSDFSHTAPQPSEDAGRLPRLLREQAAGPEGAGTSATDLRVGRRQSPRVPWAVVSLAKWVERPPGPRSFVALVVVALAVLVYAFVEAKRPVDTIGGSDVTVYEKYRSAVDAGRMPYRDFAMEYPPGALLMFVLPATRPLAGGSVDGASWFPPNAAARRYYRGFTSLVLLLLAATLVLTALTLRAMHRPARTVVLSLAVVACSPLLIEQVLIERFDVLPAGLTAAALAAAVRQHYRLAGTMLGLGAAAKFYPALLVPTLVIVTLRQRGVREAIVVTGTTVVSAIAVFLPFAIASLAGTWDSLRVQLSGGLQIETLASSVLVMTQHATDKLTALGLPPASGLTTQGAGGGLVRTDLVGSGVGTTKTVTNVLLVAALGLLWVSLARNARDQREELLRYSAATVGMLLVLGTVLSPQYVVWLVPLVPLVGGRRGTVAVLCFVVAAALTNIWIPERYFEYQEDLGVGPASLLLARNVALFAMVAALLMPGHVFRSTRAPIASGLRRDRV
jgi:Glycosyltransferase family 87